MKYLIAILIVLAGFGFSVKPAQATFNFPPFNICDILPWIPACQEDEPECEVDCNEPEGTPSAQPLSPAGEGCTDSCGGGDAHGPVCTGLPPKPATPISWSPLDDGIVAHWAVSTDPHDAQLVRFGSSKESLPYGIDKKDIGKDSTQVDLHTGFAQTWWIIGTERDNCISWSEPFDGGN